MNDEKYVRLSDAFWRGIDKRSFNITRDDGAVISNYTDAQLRDVFRIYAPISLHNSSHSPTSSTTAATCYKAGSTVTTCPSCNYSKTVTIATTAHTPNTVIPAVPATCTETGLTEGKKCSVAACGAITTEQQVVAALGHAETTIPAVAPTCTETGLTAGVECSRCNVVLTAPQTVAANGHNHTLSSSTASSDTYTCTACGDAYTLAVPTASNGAISELVSELGDVYIAVDGADQASVVQGMAIAGDYAYVARLRKGHRDANGERETLYTELLRINLLTKEEKLVFNDPYQPNQIIGLGHANDMAAVTYGDYTYLFITRYKTTVNWIKIDAEGNIADNGTAYGIIGWKSENADVQAELNSEDMGTSGIAITSFENGIVELMFANQKRFYTTEIDLATLDRYVQVDAAFEITEEAISEVVKYFFGEAYAKKFDGNIGWGYQGFSYNMDLERIFMPIIVTEKCEGGHEYRSLVLIIDKNGNILRNESFKIMEYSLEMEEIAFHGTDLYFSTICYEPLFHDCYIYEQNRIYKMPMQFFDDFIDAENTWLRNSNYVPSMQIVDGNMVAQLSQIDLANGATSVGAWFRTDMNISYTQAEIMAVRFKLENCTVADPNNHLLRFTVRTEDLNTSPSIHTPAVYVDSDGWYVAVVEPTDAMKAIDVQWLQFMFIGTSGIDESSKIVLDYVYVGSKKDAPITAQYFTVKFEDEDGTVLDVVEALYGTRAVCGSGNPTKAPDSEYHYDFAQWSASVDVITQDMTVRAQYTATAHTVTVDAAVEPNCTETGLTEGSHCSVCNEILVAQEVIDATGHDVVTDEAVAPTCTETGLTEGSHCDTCGEVFVAQNEQPAIGHSYSLYIDNGDGTHSPTCANCGDTLEAVAHSFDSSGNCVCGASNKIGGIEADYIDVVIDYGKTMIVSVRDKAIANGITQEMFAKAPLVRAEIADSAYASYATVAVFDKDGNGANDSLRFIPRKILPGVITVNCVFEVYFETAGVTNEVVVPVRMIPATTVYYETDFSKNALGFHVYGASGAPYEWTTVGTAETENQDSDTTKDQIDKFVFDRGGEIPASAFFADFTADATATERYKTNTIYRNIAANTYIYYDYVSKWDFNTNRNSDLTANTAAGTVSIKAKDWVEKEGDRYITYIQTGENSTSLHLNYHPNKDHYFQIRFKLTDLAPDVVNEKGEHSSKVALSYYTTTKATDSSGADTIKAAGSAAMPADVFTSGEYATVTFSLSGLDASVSKITSLRISFTGVKPATAGGTGTVTIDYIYCGPSTSRVSQDVAPAMNHKYTNAPYLFFDFRNDTYAQNRYASNIYGASIDDYDTQKTRWMCLSTDPKTKVDAEWSANAISNNSGNGFMRYNVGPRYETDSAGNKTYVNYFAPSKRSSGQYTFPWTDVSDIQDYPFSFSVNKELPCYGIIRFKTVGMKRIGGNPVVQFYLRKANGSNAVITPSSNSTTITNFADDTYFVAVVDLTATITDENGLNGTIHSFCIGIENLMPSTAGEYGSILIDYIYIGPEMTGANASSYNSYESNLLMDFDNTTYDEKRYAGRGYGAINLDTKDGWKTSYFTHNFNTEGVMTLKPNATFTSSSTGYALVEPNATTAVMGYKMTGNDYAVVRMKHTGLGTEKWTDPTFRIIFGTGNTIGGTTTEGVTAAVITKSLSATNNGKWMTYVFDLSSIKSTLSSKITFFRLVFNHCEVTTSSSFQIDYIYIGELLDSDAPEDALYFGFERSATDIKRYNSASYDYVNYDAPGSTKFTLSNFSESNVNNVEGTLTLTAKSGQSSFAFQTAGELNYRTKSKTMQIRFKMEDFTPTSTASDPYFRLQYVNKSGEATYVGDTLYFDAKYLSNSKYITLTLDLDKNDVFSKMNMVYGLRFFFGGMTCAADKQGKLIVDYIYIGPKDGPFVTDMTYGYDSSYQTDSLYSNGSSYFVEGSGIPVFSKDFTINEAATPAYTESTFTFTGTGFDIIGRTGANQGLIRVMIYDAQGNYVQAAQAICKSDLEYYQIPVLAVKLQNYGTYTVKLYVAAAYDFDDSLVDMGGALDRGGEFYFDALRIHNTVDTTAGTEDAQVAYNAYMKNGEADPNTKELRDILISAESFGAGDETDGVAYLNVNTETGKATVEKYVDISPNNEVYLSAGKMVAFKLEVEGAIPASVDVGAKTVNADSASMVVAVSATAPQGLPNDQTLAITSSTAQYYSLDIEDSKWQADAGKNYVYVTIYNNGAGGVLSITDIKCAYDAAATATAATKSVRFVVNAAMLESLQTVEPQTILDETLNPNMAISVGAEIQVVYTMNASNLAGFERFYLEVVKEVANGEAVTTVYSLDSDNLQPLEKNGAIAGYRATYTGINAKEMGDDFTATLYAVSADGTIRYSAAITSSIQSYLMNKLADENSIAQLKTLAVDMLNYGAAAQLNFNYDVENLVNADLTEAQKALGTKTIPEAVDGMAIRGEGIDLVANVAVKSKVELNLTCMYNTEDASNVKFVIKDAEGKLIAELTPTNHIANKAVQCTYDNVGAKQMRRLITVEVYDGDTLISKTLTWSIESYVASTLAKPATSEILANMVNAMLIYGDSAAAYLAAS